MSEHCQQSCSGDGESPQFFTRIFRKARKKHICCECRDVIEIGQKYENLSGLWEEFEVFKTCLICMKIRDDYGCCEIGTLWEDLEYSYFEPGDYEETNWLTGRKADE